MFGSSVGRHVPNGAANHAHQADKVQALTSDPKDGLAAGLAKLGGALMGRGS